MIDVTVLSKLIEHIKIHSYVCNYGYFGSPSKDKIKKSAKKLQLNIKKKLNIEVSTEVLTNTADLGPLFGEIYERLKKINIFSNQGPYMGPIGMFYNRNNALFLNLDDIEEVCLSKENFQGKKLYGSLKSKECGWISWCTVEVRPKDDKVVCDYVVSFNHHKQSSSIEEMFQKKHKYREEKLKRSFKRVFANHSYWHLEDIEKLNEKLPYIPFLKY